MSSVSESCIGSIKTACLASGEADPSCCAPKGTGACSQTTDAGPLRFIEGNPCGVMTGGPLQTYDTCCALLVSAAPQGSSNANSAKLHAVSESDKIHRVSKSDKVRAVSESDKVREVRSSVQAFVGRHPRGVYRHEEVCAAGLLRVAQTQASDFDGMCSSHSAGLTDAFRFVVDLSPRSRSTRD